MSHVNNFATGFCNIFQIKKALIIPALLLTKNTLTWTILKEPSRSEWFWNSKNLELRTYKKCPSCIPYIPTGIVMQPEKRAKLLFLFSRYSLPAIEDRFNENMNTPKSFEHIETKHRGTGDDVGIYMKFRSKNAFGALVIPRRL